MRQPQAALLCGFGEINSPDIRHFARVWMASRQQGVIAGPVRAIHVFLAESRKKDVDAARSAVIQPSSMTSKFESYARHSGAPRSGEPGIHSHRPRVMDSGLATFGGAPE